MVRRVGLFLMGALACFVACELLLRLLPVSSSTATGYDIDPDVLTYPPNHTWQQSTGWDLRNAQLLHANNAGFAAEHDFVPDPQAVALVGDSYVEASALPAAKRPGPQLERALGGRRKVYALGSPGSSLLDYAERIRMAHERWGTRDFVVVVERGDVLETLCGSGQVHAKCLDPRTLQPRTERQAPPSSLKRLLRHSALAQYVVSQLKVNLRQLPALAFPELAGPLPRRAAAVAWPAGESDRLAEAVAAQFFERVAPHVSGRLVFVVDSDRQRLERGEEPDHPDRDRFIELARAAGATVVDALPLLKQHVAQSNLSLSVGPYDAHLNELGVSLLMQAAASAMLGEAP